MFFSLPFPILVRLILLLLNCYLLLHSILPFLELSSYFIIHCQPTLRSSTFKMFGFFTFKAVMWGMNLVRKFFTSKIQFLLLKMDAMKFPSTLSFTNNSRMVASISHNININHFRLKDFSNIELRYFSFIQVVWWLI